LAAARLFTAIESSHTPICEENAFMKSSPTPVLTLLLLLAGCSPTPPGAGPAAMPPMNPADKETRIKQSLAALSAEDRSLAESQGYCPLMEKVRLGERGTPIKLSLEGETVFVCCRGCENQAKKAPAQTLTRLKSLKEKSKPEQK
jgi:hypothetical protein